MNTKVETLRNGRVQVTWPDSTVQIYRNMNVATSVIASQQQWELQDNQNWVTE